jgi:hypothetical protein
MRFASTVTVSNFTVSNFTVQTSRKPCAAAVFVERESTPTGRRVLSYVFVTAQSRAGK